MKKTLTKRIVYMCIISVIAFTNVFCSYSEKYEPSYEIEAIKLFDMGLYRGTRKDVFYPDLESSVDRQTTIVLVLRILGFEKEALSLSENDADVILDKFRDKDSLSSWTKRYVAYAVKKGIVTGYPDKNLKPNGYVTVKMYCTMILKELEYDFQYNESAELLSEIVDESYISSIEGPINKDILVGICYNTMRAKYKGNTRSIIEKLVDEGIVDRGFITPRYDPVYI